MMKPQSSPDNEEVTPSKKKLKQAQLPFKVLTVTSPKPADTQTRKRKLSVPEQEPVSKVGKLTKENDVPDLVEISDDDSNTTSTTVIPDQNNTKTFNPYVKLVDTAWKKKLQKKTSSKKKKIGPKSKTKLTNGHAAENNTDDKKNGDCEMEVDEVLENEQTEAIVDTKDVSQEMSQVILKESDNILTIEDSNDEPESKNTENTEEDNQTNVSDTEDKENKIDSIEVEKPPSPVTPRRTRQSERSDKSLNASQISEETGSNQNTPKRSARNSTVKNDGDVSMNGSPGANLTPKQLQKKLEYAKKREEREKKKQQEKEERERLKQEKEAQRKKEKEEKEEMKRREKEEKEEQKRKDKEEKEKQRELEKKLKEEKEEQKKREREEKEEQKRKEKEAREEEKRKKQEAMELEKLEQEQKKKKAAEAFASFFVPKQKVEKECIVGLSKNDMLSNFTIKADMRIAPAVRNPLTEERRRTLDKYLETQNLEELYIKDIKTGRIKPLTSGKTWPLGEKDDDCIVVEDELPPIDGAGEILACDTGVREKLRPKLLSFHENRRPPYWGTWRKKSAFINPRKPFSMDQKQIDYEVDSDEEWEEEEGESVDGSAAGSDDDGPDDYELDHELFVPHGYLSDEEATMDDDDVMSLSPETQKARLKYLEDEFESELKKPMEKLKPRLYGPIWANEDGGKPENCPDALWNYFSKLAMIMNDPSPFLQPITETEEPEKKKVKKKKDNEQKSPAEKKKPKQDKEKKKEKAEKQEKNQLGINAFLTKVKGS